tara:strand:- start:3178 stop:4752 length:1575 start_codon:yes stop_codon:yes gene_type:complete
MQFVLNELKSAKEFVQARQKHKQQVNLDQILTSMSSNFVKKLESNRLSPSELTKVMTELEDSPYMDEDTAKIISLLDAKMLGSSEPTGATKSDNRPTIRQNVSNHKSVMDAWHNYMDSNDWNRFCDPNKSFYLKYEHAVYKSRTFGCIDPEEQSIKALLALLLKLHFGTDQPDALQKFRYFNDLKLLFTTSIPGRKSSTPTPMNNYPTDPGELPDSVKSALTGYVIREESADIIGVNAIMNSIPMRRGSALLNGYDKNAILDACKSLPRASPTKYSQKSSDSHKSSDSQGSSDSKPTPDIKSEHHAAPHPDSSHGICNFCPKCGFQVCKQSVGVEDTPENSDIVSKIRIGGVPFKRELTAVKTEAVVAQTIKPVEQPTQPVVDTPVVDTHKSPGLDAVSLAALHALQTRKEKKRAAEAYDAGHTDGAKDEDDDDDDDEAAGGGVGSGEVAAVMPKTRAIGKRPACKRPASKVKHTTCIMKKPSSERSGCCKCRGTGCGTCRAKTFTGKRITRAEYLRTHPDSKK